MMLKRMGAILTAFALITLVAATATPISNVMGYTGYQCSSSFCNAWVGGSGAAFAIAFGALGGPLAWAGLIMTGA